MHVLAQRLNSAEPDHHLQGKACRLQDPANRSRTQPVPPSARVSTRLIITYERSRVRLRERRLPYRCGGRLRTRHLNLKRTPRLHGVDLTSQTAPNQCPTANNISLAINVRKQYAPTDITNGSQHFPGNFPAPQKGKVSEERGDVQISPARIRMTDISTSYDSDGKSSQLQFGRPMPKAARPMHAKHQGLMKSGPGQLIQAALMQPRPQQKA